MRGTDIFFFFLFFVLFSQSTPRVSDNFARHKPINSPTHRPSPIITRPKRVSRGDLNYIAVLHKTSRNVFSVRTPRGGAMRRVVRAHVCTIILHYVHIYTRCADTLPYDEDDKARHNSRCNGRDLLDP